MLPVRRWLSLMLAGAALVPALSLPSRGQQVARRATPDVPTTSATETVIYSFCESSPGCTFDPAGVVQGADGNFYGATVLGGADFSGEIFKASQAGQLTDLYDFTDDSGSANTTYQLTQAQNGDFYGTYYPGAATSGQGSGYGFSVSTSGVYSPTAYFPEVYTPQTGLSTGNLPSGRLIQDSAGNFYGTAAGTGSDQGEIFRIGADGLSVLYSFTNGADGRNPRGGLVQASDGNFYGVANGGANGVGVLFQFVLSTGKLNVLHAFTGGTDGSQPAGPLAEGPNGFLYGVAVTGGDVTDTNCTGQGCGALYSYAIGSGTFSVLHDFTGNADGGIPVGVILGSDGNLYGSAALNVLGSVFRSTPAGAVATLYNFCSIQDANGNCLDGNRPSQLVQGADGTFYGTTSVGGTTDNGTLFNLALSPGLPAPIQLTAPGAATVGVAVEVAFSSLNSFSITMQQCNAFVTNQSSGAETALGAVAGTFVSGVFSGSFRWTPLTAATYLVAVTCGGTETGTATVNATAAGSGPYATVQSLITNASPLISGQQFILSVAVTANGSSVKGGSVALACGGLSLGSVPVTAGTAMFSIPTFGLPAGVYACVTTYSGVQGLYLGSSATLNVTVVDQNTTLALNPATATWKIGSTVTLAANVSGQEYTPTSGTVVLRLSNGFVLGESQVNAAGSAHFNLYAGAPAGNYLLTATYYGTSGTNGSSATGTYTLQQ